MPEAGILGLFRARILDRPRGAHLRGRSDVIEQRRNSPESAVPHQFFVIEGALGAAEDDVAFRGNLSEPVVKDHDRSCLNVPLNLVTVRQVRASTLHGGRLRTLP
jgi:hypothetical protein